MKTPSLRSALRWSLLIAIVAAGCFEIGTRVVPLPASLSIPQLETTTLVDRSGATLASLPSKGTRECHPIPFKEMGTWLPQVTVNLEDHRFYQHRGIDLHATFAASIRNLGSGNIVSGGSTITQQVIKLASGRLRRSWWQKIYENIAAIRLERIWSKERILQEYLNRNHYGNLRVGVAAAARAYFNKSPANLSLPESIYLAGLPQAPTRFNPWLHPSAAEERYQRSLVRLQELHFFPSANSFRLSAKTPLPIPREKSARPAPHFVDLVTQLKPFPPGIVQTTLDLDLQRFIEKEFEMHLGELAPRRVSQGAVVVLDTRSGAVRAMIGSRAYKEARTGQVNGTLAYRSCGSTLKPFLYLHALDIGTLTAATLLPDTPDAVRAQYIDYDPLNYDKRFWGPVRVREALANSLNVPAVVTLSRIGARQMFAAFENFGLKFAHPFDEYGAGLILGNAEVRLIDLTAAFTLFAGSGVAVQPRLLEAAPARHRSLAPANVAAIIGDILSDNGARKKTFGAFSPLAFENLRIPCKTGTSSGFRDAWCVGTTKEHAVGVWVGNFDGHSMEEVAAVVGAAPLWRKIVEHLLERGDSSVPSPDVYPELVQRDICRLTGLRPSEGSPGIVKEWFVAGTEPVHDASLYLRNVGDQTKILLPEEFALWCRSGQNYLGAEISAESRLRIISPSPNATFLLDSNLPRSQQAIRLIAVGATESMRWKVDGQPIVAVRNNFFWPLTGGLHTVEVETSTDCATGKFTVE